MTAAALSSEFHTADAPARARRAEPWLLGLLAIVVGVAITVCVRGYRFGESNHAVYLLAALREIRPGTLDNDWWTRSTLQYHVAFNSLTVALMRAGILQPAFLAGYVALAALLHVGWYRLTLRLGGTGATYLLSVTLYYLLAGGLGLGHYHFLQDSAFLPSNISNVAMLWGLYFWVCGRRVAAGTCLGVAGLFHINHAAVAVGLWGVLSILEVRRARPEARGATATFRDRHWWLGGVALVGLSALSILPAVPTVLARSGSLPLAEFVDLFVRLRHPHHFDPLSWHWALWLTFLLPIPLAAVAARHALRERPGPEVRRAVEVFFVLAGLTGFALVVAGVWFARETFVQLNLYRFSIYLKLMSCIGAASLTTTAGHRLGRAVLAVWLGAAGVILLLFTALLLAGGRLAPHVPAGILRNVPVLWLLLLIVFPAVLAAKWWTRGKVGAVLTGLAVAVGLAATIGGWPRLGVAIEAVRGERPAYLALAAWAKQHTPAGAVFLVPPEEQSFRLRAERAIVVNFKNVPQLSAELPEWRDRLKGVLDLDDLMRLPRPMGATLEAIGRRYDAIPPAHLVGTARRYGAEYVVTRHRIPPGRDAGLKIVYETDGYFLYHLPGATDPPAGAGRGPREGGRGE